MASIWKYTDGDTTVYGIYEGRHTNGLRKWASADEATAAATKGGYIIEGPVLEITVPATTGVSVKQIAYASDTKRHELLGLVGEQEQIERRLARKVTAKKQAEAASINYRREILVGMTNARTILDGSVYREASDLAQAAFAAAVEDDVDFDAALQRVLDDPRAAKRYRHAISYVREEANAQ